MSRFPVCPSDGKRLLATGRVLGAWALAMIYRIERAAYLHRYMAGAGTAAACGLESAFRYGRDDPGFCHRLRLAV